MQSQINSPDKDLQSTEEQELVNEARLDPLKDGISSLELMRVSGSDLDVVNAARVSYGKLQPN